MNKLTLLITMIAQSQFYQQEAAKLRVQISNLQNHNRQVDLVLQVLGQENFTVN